MPGYASPVAIVAGGRLPVIATRRGRKDFVGVDAATGALLGALPFVTPYEQNAVTPAVAGDLVVLFGLDQSMFAVRPTRGADGSGRR